MQSDLSPSITITDVALAAAVSETTVSHVFSRRRPVAPATRARVLEAAARLGYQPHAGARDLGAGRSTTIALDIEIAGEALLLNPYFSAVVSSLSAAASARGFTFMLLPGTPDTIEATLPLLGNGRVTGAIVLEPTSSNTWIPRLVNAGIGVVTIGRYIGTEATCWVDNDHRGAAAILLEHLVEQGYRRIALITAIERFSLMQDLELEFEQGIPAHGVDGQLVRIAELTEDAGRRAAMELLGGAHPPDAIVAAIDRVAVGVLRAADELGVRVPDDLAVVGGGDTVLSQNAHPRLTSIRTTPDLLASGAVEIINDAWVNGWPNPPRSIVLPSDLVIRESTRRHA